MSLENVEKVGLCLSGGGFRATLYHLGVIRYLREVNLLKKVTHITSVSGGSIFAAHLVLNWERYNGTDAEFEAATGELETFARWDLRGRVIRAWLFGLATPIPVLFPLLPAFQPGRWGRTDRLQAGFEYLFRRKKLKDLGRAATGRPHLYMLATCFTTGHLVSFDHREMRFNWDPEVRTPVPYPDRLPAPEVPVALAVAASSAFPAVFPPVQVSRRTFGDPPEYYAHPLRLADGGVFDNLGIRKLLWVVKEDKVDFDLVIVSDANRSLTAVYDEEFNWFLSRAGRWTDVMMERLSEFDNTSLQRLKREARSGPEDTPVLFCRLKESVDTSCPHALPQPTQFAVQNLRTDLDAFSRDEVAAVTRHGYSTAASAYARLDHGAAAPKPPAGTELMLEGGSGLRRGLFRWDDWASWALWFTALGLYVCLPLGIVVGSVWYGRAAEEWRRQAEEGQAAAKGAAAVAEKARSKASEEQQRAEREYQRQWHFGMKTIIAQRAGRLAASENEAQWKVGRKDWAVLLSDLRKDEWFDLYLDDPEEGGTLLEAIQGADKAIAAGKAVTPELLAEVRAQATEVANDLGSYFLASEDRQRIFRLNWEGELSKAEVAMENIMGKLGRTSNDISLSRFELRSLRFGEVAMLRKHPAVPALNAFVVLLDEWARTPDKTATEVGLAAKLRSASAAFKTARTGAATPLD